MRTSKVSGCCGVGIRNSRYYVKKMMMKKKERKAEKKKKESALLLRDIGSTTNVLFVARLEDHDGLVEHLGLVLAGELDVRLQRITIKHTQPIHILPILLSLFFISRRGEGGGGGGERERERERENEKGAREDK